MTATIGRNGSGAGLNVKWKKISDQLVPPLVAIAIFLIVWELLSRANIILLPGPSSL